jgi:hypothetical protein
MAHPQDYIEYHHRTALSETSATVTHLSELTHSSPNTD